MDFRDAGLRSANLCNSSTEGAQPMQHPYLVLEGSTKQPSQARNLCSSPIVSQERTMQLRRARLATYASESVYLGSAQCCSLSEVHHTRSALCIPWERATQLPNLMPASISLYNPEYLGSAQRCSLIEARNTSCALTIPWERATQLPKLRPQPMQPNNLPITPMLGNPPNCCSGFNHA